MKQLLVVASLALLLFSACKKNDLSPSSSSNSSSKPVTDEKYLTLIKNLGFSTTKVVERGKYIITEGDIMLAKSFLDTLKLSTVLANNERFKQIADKQSPNARLARTINLLSSHNLIIRVPYVNSIIYDASYRAMAEWNALSNCDINLYRITNTEQPADYEMFIDNALGAYAASDFPGYPDANGYPGYNIVVNENQMRIDGYQWNNCARVLMHEIGHACGIRHQDWENDLSGGPNDPGAIYIPGAPVSDPASVFISTVGWPSNMANYPNPQFSTADVAALQTVYPFQSCNLQGYINFPGAQKWGVVTASAYEFAYPSLFEQITWVEATVNGVSTPYTWSYSGPIPEDGFYWPQSMQVGQSYQLNMRYTNAKGCTSSWGSKNVTLTN